MLEKKRSERAVYFRFLNLPEISVNVLSSKVMVPERRNKKQRRRKRRGPMVTRLGNNNTSSGFKTSLRNFTSQRENIMRNKKCKNREGFYSCDA
jgi:hypothetical protein